MVLLAPHSMILVLNKKTKTIINEYDLYIYILLNYE